MNDFLKCLFSSKFWSRKRTCRDIFEPECLVFLLLGILDYSAYKFLDARDEPDENECIDCVKEVSPWIRVNDLT